MSLSLEKIFELNEVLVQFEKYVNFFLVIILENLGFFFQVIILSGVLRND